MAATLAYAALSYQVGAPSTRGTAIRAAPAVMQEQQYKLNNYMLPGPLTPLADQILVKQSKMADVTTGGLFMPADSTEKPSEGLVVLAGPGTTHPETGKLIPNPCKEGDLILLSEYVGEKVDYCGDKHAFVSASEVLGVFDGGSPVVGSFKPLQDRVLVKLQDAATETSSGIALASESTDEPTQGEVIAVGEGLVTSQGDLVPPGITVGESVIYGKYTGTMVFIGGVEYKVVSASDCLAKW